MLALRSCLAWDSHVGTLFLKIPGLISGAHCSSFGSDGGSLLALTKNSTVHQTLLDADSSKHVGGPTKIL